MAYQAVHHNMVAIKILRRCTGRRGVALMPGDVVSLHKQAARAFVQRGDAAYVKVETKIETKGGPRPEPPKVPVMRGALTAAAFPMPRPVAVVASDPVGKAEEESEAVTEDEAEEAVVPDNECPQCGKVCKSVRGLQIHMGRAHK